MTCAIHRTSWRTIDRFGGIRGHWRLITPHDPADHSGVSNLNLPSPSVEEPQRVRGLDGLRAVAVTGVVVYHVYGSWLPGGFLGVDLFFVISGYLITSLLTADRRRAGRFRLGPFWVRRARRLLPALWVVLTVTACAATLTGGDAFAGLRGNVAAALTYSSNWWQIAQNDSYFAAYGARPVLEHLWSLAVEEQFYVLWPLLLWAIMSALPRQRHQTAVAALMGSASFAAMALLYTPDGDSSRVYFGTDTHGGGLLLGAAAALALPLARAATLRRPNLVRTLDILGAAGLAVLAVASLTLSGTGAAVYRGGLLVASLASVGVTVASAAPGRVGRALSLRPLVWLGRRSYGVYLWHWPILAIVGNAFPGWADTGTARATALVLTAVLATLSYRLLEEPLIRLGVRGYVGSVRARLRALAADRPRHVFAMLAAGTGVITVAALGVTHAPAQSGLKAQIAQGEREAAGAGAARLLPGTPGGGRRPNGAAAPGGNPGQGGGPGPGGAPSPALTGDRITAVGDSVMLAATGTLEGQIPGIAVYAKVGRQLSAAPAILRELQGAGRLRDVVLIGLGTNGDFSQATIERILRIAGPSRTVAFINVHVPKPWQDPVNAGLATAVRTHPHTLLIDWNAAISPHPEQLWTDRTHPRPSGTLTYARAIAEALHLPAA